MTSVLQKLLYTAAGLSADVYPIPRPNFTCSLIAVILCGLALSAVLLVLSSVVITGVYGSDDCEAEMRWTMDVELLVGA